MWLMDSHGVFIEGFLCSTEGYVPVFVILDS